MMADRGELLHYSTHGSQVSDAVINFLRTLLGPTNDTVALTVPELKLQAVIYTDVKLV